MATKGNSPLLRRMSAWAQDISEASNASWDSIRANISGGDWMVTQVRSMPSGRTIPVRRASVRS